MIEYLCEGCGIEVHAYYASAVPEHGFCLTCELLDRSFRHDLKEFAAVYDRVMATKDERP